MKNENCPCGRDKSYEDCCGIIHQDINKAFTAEDLMRSRYTAYVLADGDYLMKSNHSETRNIEEKQEIEEWAASVSWEGLKVLKQVKGKAEDTEGTVAFKAFYTDRRGTHTIKEKSYFKKENGYWVYVDKF